MAPKRKPGPKPGNLVPQPHGGALIQGPTPPENHVPGPGRPPSRIRGSLRVVFDQAIQVLEDVTQGKVMLRFFEKCPECGHEAEEHTGIAPKVRVSDVLKAIDIAGKYGMGEAKGFDDELVEKLAEATRRHMGDEFEELRDEWKLIIDGHLS